jgi:hypothetical protein
MKPYFVVLCLVVAMGLSWGCEGCANFESISQGNADVKMVQGAYSLTVIFLLGVPVLCILALVRFAIKLAPKTVLPPGGR